MTLPCRVVGFLGVVQALLATYSVLAVNFYLAVRPAGNPALVKAFADYGILLFLVPLAWTVISALSVGKPESRRSAAPLAFWSWLAITLLMLAGDILLAVHAVGPSAALKV
jgi:hypothetical protein